MSRKGEGVTMNATQTERLWNTWEHTSMVYAAEAALALRLVSTMVDYCDE
jgi:hypothetical protein